MDAFTCVWDVCCGSNNMQFQIRGKVILERAYFSAMQIYGIRTDMFEGFIRFFRKKYSIREVILDGMAGILLIISMCVTEYRELLIFWVFIVAAHDIDFEEIIKLSVWVHVVCLIFVIGSCYAGILENKVYGLGGNRIRESLGFGWTTEGSNFFFYTLLMWIYWRKNKIRIEETVLLAAISIYFFVKTDTKSAFFLGMIALVGANLLKYMPGLMEYKKTYSAVAIGIVPVLAFFVIWVSAKYDSSVLWMKKLNNLVNGRLNLGKSGFKNYGIHIFGQKIIWVGGEPAPPAVYNFADSSYVQNFLNFGPIIFVLILGWLVCIGISISMRKDTYFLLVFAIMAVHTTFDPQLLWIGYNSFLMAYSYIKLKNGHPCVPVSRV